MQTVWKGKMSSARVEAHRGILVSSCVGKSLYRAVRSRAVGPLAAISSPMQLGGLPQRPVSLASHAVRMFQQGAQKHGSSYSLVFLDLREAVESFAHSLQVRGSMMKTMRRLLQPYASPRILLPSFTGIYKRIRYLSLQGLRTGSPCPSLRS